MCLSTCNLYDWFHEFIEIHSCRSFYLNNFTFDFLVNIRFDEVWLRIVPIDYFFFLLFFRVTRNFFGTALTNTFFTRRRGITFRFVTVKILSTATGAWVNFTRFLIFRIWVRALAVPRFLRPPELQLCSLPFDKGKYAVVSLTKQKNLGLQWIIVEYKLMDFIQVQLYVIWRINSICNLFCLLKIS